MVAYRTSSILCCWGGGDVNVLRMRKILDHIHFSLGPCPFCTLDAVGQAFVGCSNQKTIGKSSKVCFTATYS